MQKRDVVGNKIIKILVRNSGKGLTITELVDTSKISRSAVRTTLAKLEGAGKVSIRKVGMAKIYFLKEQENEKLKMAIFILIFLSLSVASSELTSAIGNPLTGIIREEQRNPNQLFDIKFELEDYIVLSIEDFIVRVTFESFGTEPTPVDMEFIFLGEDGKEIYRERDYIVVETEKVFTKEVEGFRFDEGEYTLVLKTLYNVDVEDEFRRKFEVKREERYRLGTWISWIIIVFLLGFIFFVLRKQGRIKIKHGRK